MKVKFEDIESGQVDIVVVYKVDRLTRSLMDFSKIVELFDKNSASFVSITQNFNTTTSMGRLTLNILLSFAQFEREVTGERIRDKVAASKKKGMWMSGVAPIGYKLTDKKLVIDEDNAEKLRLIFNKYLELKGVPGLKNYLDGNNIKTRKNMHFSKGSLYLILENKVYIGKIVHKDKVYEGEHQSIIDIQAFEEAQKLLTENRITEKASLTSKESSLFAGKIFDDNENYMSPSHSNKKGKRYRYYVSQALIQGRRHEAGSVSKIPSSEIETVVAEELLNFISDTRNIQQYIENYDIHKQKELLQTIKRFKTDLAYKYNNLFIRTILSKVILYKEKIDFILCKEQLIKALESITYDTPFPEELKSESKAPIAIIKEIRISATSRNGSILIISDSKKKEVNINNHLITAIAKSYHWNNLLITGEVENIKAINKMENLSGHKYIYKVIELRFLAPDIIEKILNGTQPKDLSVQKLLNVKTLDWNEQKKLLNF